MQVSNHVGRAFTLVEVLIVVIVLGILAAIVVPQFSSASDDANLAALTTNLQTIRGQLELYKMQHNLTYPTLASFTAQMTAGTKADGTAGTDFGPYLMSVPVNPFSNVNTLTTEAAGSGKGWYYNETTGEFRANDSVAHRAL
jgi:general secretion pathway protein G